jgi:CrcB protein
VSAPVWIAVGLLGGAPSVARYLLGGIVTAAARSSFPLGTLLVNVSGALALGVLIGLRVHGTALVGLLGTATLGAFTTFSTWMLESDRLWRYERLRPATVNVAASLGAGVAAVALGRLLG